MPTLAVSVPVSAAVARVIKTPLVAAGQTTDDKRPMAIHLRRVRGIRKKVSARDAQSSLEPTCTIWSDGLACFQAVTEWGCRQLALQSSGGRAGAWHPTSKWVNTLLGSVKSAIIGTYHGVDPKHLPRCPAEFEYRFNRRLDLPAVIERLSLRGGANTALTLPLRYDG